MKESYKGTAKYYIGNSRNLGSIFKKKDIPPPTLIISSPPYFDKLDYHGTANQIGYGQKDYSSYLVDVASVFQQAYELSAANATFWLIIDTVKKNGEISPLPFDIHRQLKMQKIKTWKLKEVVVWDKGKNLPWNSNGKFKNQFEYILFFTKGAKFKFNLDSVREINDLKKWWLSYPERYNPNGKAPSNVWQYTTPIRGWGNGKQNHFCPIPFPLAEKIISISTTSKDIVFDPFAGSGTALAIAKCMGRNGFGIDINNEYKKKFYSEVLSGANNYWKNRLAELKFNSKAINKFSSTNLKLRKLKVASSLANYINKISSKPFVHIVINRPGYKFDLLIVENGYKPLIKIKDKNLIELIKQSKVAPNIVVINEEDIQTISSKRLFRYALDKFYSVNSFVSSSNILKSDVKYKFLHSNFNVLIK